jgi:hypothetical protein
VVIVISPVVDLPLTVRTDGIHQPTLLDGGAYVAAASVQMFEAFGRVAHWPLLGAAPLASNRVTIMCTLLC